MSACTAAIPSIMRYLLPVLAIVDSLCGAVSTRALTRSLFPLQGSSVPSGLMRVWFIVELMLGDGYLEVKVAI